MEGSLLQNRNKRLEQTCRRLKLQWFKHSSICNLVRILLSRRGRYSFNRNFYFSILSLIWETVPLIILISGWYFYHIFFCKCRDMTTDCHHAILKVAEPISFLFYFRNISFKVKSVDVSPSWVQNRNPGSSLFQQVWGGNDDWIIKEHLAGDDDSWGKA